MFVIAKQDMQDKIIISCSGGYVVSLFFVLRGFKVFFLLNLLLHQIILFQNSIKLEPIRN